MKLILFADRLPPLIGGMETHAHYFVQHFKTKYELAIVSRKEGKDCLVNEKYEFIEFIDLTVFLESINDEKVVVFYNSGRWIEQMLIIRSLLPKALIYYRTGGNEIIKAPLSFDMPNYEERKSYWKNQINNGVDYLITNSDFTDKRLLDFGINSALLAHIAGGIDSKEIDMACSCKEETREKYGINNDEILVSSCARFVPYKRPEFLIDTLSKCESKLTVLFAGDGPLLDTCRSKAKELNLNVKFLGVLTHEESLKLIAASDLYVQASTDLVVEVPGGSYVHTEGMGRSLLEAISSGVPVVVSNCGAVCEYISSENGALVNSQDEMIKAINDICKSKRRVENMNVYKDKYSFDYIFEEYETLWRKKGF